MSTKITYNSTTTEVANGKIATLSCNGKKMKSDIVVEVPSAEDSAVPTEVATEAEMTALLESGEVGGVYKYTGTTGTYENGALYVLEEEAAEDALAGTWELNNVITVDRSKIWNVAFTRPEVSANFVAFRLYYSSGSNFSLEYGFQSGAWLTVYDADGWDNDSRIINITSNLADVTDGDTLLTWLQSNATKQGATSTITFTVGSSSFEAEEGMTWSEWCDSEYNTDGYSVQGSTVRIGGSAYHGYITLDDARVNPTDIIVDGTAYGTEDWDSGGSNE